MTDMDVPPPADGPPGASRRHRPHHHDRHDGKYAWSGEEAERFLLRMRRGARRAYAPMVAA